MVMAPNTKIAAAVIEFLGEFLGFLFMAGLLISYL